MKEGGKAHVNYMVQGEQLQNKIYSQSNTENIRKMEFYYSEENSISDL